MKAKLIGLLILILSWCSPALANTVTYTYTGADYIYWAQFQGFCCVPFTQADLLGRAQNLGPHMSISVTFQNVTSALNGNFDLIAPPPISGPYASSASITNVAGSFSIPLYASSITLVDGAVTSWRLGFTFLIDNRPCGAGEFVAQCQIISSPTSGDEITVWTGFTGYRYGVHTDTTGVWTSDAAHAPGPIAGAGLPGLVLVGLLGWWCRRRHRQGSVLA